MQQNRAPPKAFSF